ncbi:MAG: hypothetical protein HC889_09340 [Synechococcaceae cyanobacterium SM1_2_3]|nr:hypothetical protein [Synechococcaceae cyanobacterium SM1_2_3]
MTTHDEFCFCNHSPEPSPTDPGRRRFIRLATLGTGVALLGLATPWRLAAAEAGHGAAAHTAEAMLLSCMDYRLVDDITKYMDGRGMTNQYDHVVLAGASLGAITGDFKDWNKTFWAHLKIASDLHQIKKVILLDHRDCGAYKVILKADFSKDPALETRVHGKYLRDLDKEIRKRYPKLETEMLIMNLDGTVETIR